MNETELRALRAMSVPAIRRAQAIVRAQQPLAHAKGLTDALAKLNEWERDYTNELLRRTEV